MSVNIFTTPIKLTSKLTTGSWSDIDLSSLAIIPSNCQGVILSGSTMNFSNLLNTRKKGSTDNRIVNSSLGTCDTGGHILLFSGTNTSKTFQTYSNDASIARLNLLGYTTEDDILYLTNAISITLSSTGAWETIDVSSTLDASYSAAIVLIENQNYPNNYQFDIREAGDILDLYDNGQKILYRTYRHYVIGINSSRQFQFKRENSDIKLYIIGGVKSIAFTSIKRTYSETFTATHTKTDIVTRYNTPFFLHNQGSESSGQWGWTGIRPTETNYDIEQREQFSWMRDQHSALGQALVVPRSSDKKITYWKNAANLEPWYYTGYFTSYNHIESSIILDLRGNNTNGSQIFIDESLFAHTDYTVTGNLINTTADHQEGQGCISSPDHSSYMRYFAKPEFALGSSWTIEFYCKLPSDYNNGVIGNFVEVGDETINTGIGIGARTGTIGNYGIWAYWGPGTGWTALDGFSFNTWHHVATTSDGFTLYFFKDGTLQTTYSTPPNLTQNVINLFYSLLYTAGRIKGKLDYVRISNTCNYTANFTPPIPPQTYTYSGAQTLALIPNAIGRLQNIYRYLGNTVFSLTPNAQVIFGHIFRYSGDINFNFTVAGAYRRIYKVYRYSGNMGFELIPASANELRTDFQYSGNTNVVFLPASQVRHAFNYAYNGELTFSLSEESFYVFGLGYLYNGNVGFELNSDADTSLNYTYVGDLEIVLVPDSDYYAILQAYAPMQKLPIQILPNLKKLFRIKAQKILVYPAIVRKNDPYEKTKTRHLLPAISMQALVKDFSPSALVWQNLGLSEIGAKTLVFEKKYIDLLKVAGKIEIDGVEYAVYRDAGNQAQIWDKADMGVALIKKL
jgi:hypothetical protein